MRRGSFSLVRRVEFCQDMTKQYQMGVDNEVAHEAISFYSVAWKIRRRRRRSWSPQSAKLTFTVDWQGFADLGNAASTARTARCDKRAGDVVE